jgi:thioredoxin-dependent peroxiredoxin
MPRHRRIVPALAAIAALAVLATTGSAAALEVGQKAPDFTLAAADGRQVKLADLLGKGPVVIYTFIQAFTAA